MIYGRQFTEWLPTKDSCNYWYEWFHSRGTPAAIIERVDGNYYNYAVFRRGKVMQRSDKSSGHDYLSDCDEDLNDFKNEPVVHAHCNDYL